MEDINTVITKHGEEIKKIAFKHGVKNVRVFGSVARGEAGKDSDIDILVEVGESTSPWFPGGLIVELEELLGCKVEIVTDKGLHPGLRQEVLDEAVQL